VEGPRYRSNPTVRRAAGGITDASGKFQLTTLNANDGAMPGKYKVAVSKAVATSEASQITAEDRRKW